MKIGKVIGNVVSSIKDPGLDSLRLLVIQGLDDNLEPIGNPYVAVDGILTAGPEDLVYLVSKKEAALVFSKELVPIDECIVGFVDEHFVPKRAKKKVSKKKLPPTLPKKELSVAQGTKPPKKIELSSSEPIKKFKVVKPTESSIKTDSHITNNKQPRKTRAGKKKKLPQDNRRQPKSSSQRRKSQ